MPLSGEAHYAKIAGEEVLIHVPVVQPPEAPAKVEALRPGTLAYWPTRQALCLYYGRIQPEAASVNVLGEVISGLAELAEAGEAVRREQGRRLIRLTVTREGRA